MVTAVTEHGFAERCASAAGAACPCPGRTGSCSEAVFASRIPSAHPPATCAPSGWPRLFRYYGDELIVALGVSLRPV